MLIVVCVVLAALLGAAPALHERSARKRAAVRERERYDRIIDEQAALHRAIADKLIPRFAARAKVTPLTAIEAALDRSDADRAGSPTAESDNDDQRNPAMPFNPCPHCGAEWSTRSTELARFDAAGRRAAVRVTPGREIAKLQATIMLDELDSGALTLPPAEEQQARARLRGVIDGEDPPSFEEIRRLITDTPSGGEQ